MDVSRLPSSNRLHLLHEVMRGFALQGIGWPVRPLVRLSAIGAELHAADASAIYSSRFWL